MMSCVEPGLLLPKHLFDPADFLLDFAGEFLALAFRYHVGIVRDPTHFFFSFTFDFMKLAFNPILRARFHGVLASPE
jgi:hypothetical protein